MGGKGGDRKSYKATSSAKAAEALAAKGGTAGFGGFGGIRPTAGFGFGAPAAATVPSSGSASAESSEVSAQLDGDLAQCLRHLSKKDTTTKMKALQNLKDYIPQKGPADLTLFLQPWIYQFKRLLLDPAKAVRSEAVAIMAAVGTSVGKALAPQLKAVLGPWYLACFDPYADAAGAARRSLGEVFPGQKQTDALIYCRSDVLTHIVSSFTSTPQTLGDPRKDTPEEMEERHERIVSASLAAAAALLTTFQQQQQQDIPLDQPDGQTQGQSEGQTLPPAAAAVEETRQKLREILSGPGFFKKYLVSKSILVRRASYGFVQVLSAAAADLLRECQAAAAPAVLGALQEKEPSNHSAMWEMVLAYITSQQPSCWEAVKLQKAFMPRLLALLRHGCYGSAATSMPALLPLLLLLPRQLLTMQADRGLVLDQILEAVWMGAMQHCGAGSNARAAAVAAYLECMHWGLRNADALSGNAPDQQQQQQQAGRQYCVLLLQRGHFTSVLDAAMISSSAEGETAAAVMQDLLLLLLGSSAMSSSSSSAEAYADQPAAAAELPIQLDVLVAAFAAAIQRHLTAVAAAHNEQQQQQLATASVLCTRLQQLFDMLSENSNASSNSQAVAERLAGSCCSVLLPLLQAGQQLPTAASRLVAKLIREYPCAGAAAAAATNGSSSSSITALVCMGIRACSSAAAAASSPAAAAADLDLLLSCIAGSSDPAAAWSVVYDNVLDHVSTSADSNTYVAAWRFVSTLMQKFVAGQSTFVTSAAAAAAASDGAAPNWSHSGLDQLLLLLMQQLKAAAAGDVAAAGAAFGSLVSQQQQQQGLNSSPATAAAAALLGCCLGANEQQQVLVSHNALDAVMQDMCKCVSAALEALQQQQQQHDAEPAAAVAAAACVCIAALHAVFKSSSHGDTAADSSSSSSTIWQQQPEVLVALLLLLAQLTWVGQEPSLLLQLDLAATAAIDDNSSSSDDQADDSIGDSSSSSSSSSGEYGDLGGDLPLNSDDHTHHQIMSISGSSSSSGHKPWTRSMQQAASKVWSPELLSSAVDDLPGTAGQRLITQLQLLLIQGIAAAAAAGAADGLAAAAAAGLMWGRRAAVVLSGLEEQQQQQDLLQQLLDAVPAWQQWSRTSSSSGSSSCAHIVLIHLVAALVHEVGCNVVFPLGSHYTASHTKAELASLESSRQWLLVELLCSNASAAAVGATSDSGSSSSSSWDHKPAQQYVAAAAAAAQRHLLRTACRSSSTAAAAAARSVLYSILKQLLVSAAAAATDDATVYCDTLSQLLQQIVTRLDARPSSQQQLLPLLQNFMAQQVTTAASRYTAAAAAGSADGSSSSSSGDASCPAWILVHVIEVLAQAFRFSHDESCVTASGLSQLSVGFMNKALTLEPQISSSSSGDCSLEFEEILQLTVACFPNKAEADKHHEQHPHHRLNAAAAASSRAGMAVGSSTALERQALTALLRHACSSSSSAGVAPAAAAPVVDLQCQLQLSCVTYCWQDMSAAEWHIVLRDSQQRLTNVRREVERAAGSLAAAACAAAQQLASAAAAADEIMTPNMAIEVLRGLDRKGLLQRQPALTQQIRSAVDQAVASLSKVSLPGLRMSLLLLAAVLQLQQQIQAAGRAPQLDLALQSAWRELLAMLMALGAAAAVAAAGGAAVAAVLQQCMESEGPTWQLLSSCLSDLDHDLISKVLSSADDRMDMIGVDSVSSCLALLQAPWIHVSGPITAAAAAASQQHGACEPLQRIAWQMLLNPSSIASIAHVAAATSSSDGEELPEYGINDDAATYLVQIGLRPETAAAITRSQPWQVHLLHWTLLLAHISQLNAKRSSSAAIAASRRLTQALRDVPELVPNLLGHLVSLMGLGSSSSSSNLTAAAGTDPTSDQVPAAATSLSAAAQVQLSAKLTALCPSDQPWTLITAIHNIGLPTSHSSWRILAAAVYRAVLGLLPASARIWFSDLRDRRQISAVESYTTRFESPALLAAEFAAIRRDAAGSSGEVGGSCSFRVTSSPAAREVTAVLEIEDGATLELQVKLPAAAPLKAAEVECRNKVGIKDGRLRKWLLSIAVFLRNQNQGVLDAISMWKANLEQEFAGVQPCLICYSVISAANGQLPRLSCRQCSVTFHPACLYKWFRSSGKSTCPHCQAPW